VRLLLVDGNNVVHRCASVRIGALWSEIIATSERMIQRAAREFVHATHLIVAFDSIEPSFRRVAYPDYKGNREPNEARQRLVVEAALAFESTGIFCAVGKCFEADDVIATIAHRLTQANPDAEAHVLSIDSDLLSLAGGAIHCWQFGRKGKKGEADEAFVVERTPAWICERYGLDRVDQLADYKAIVGEPTDNLPGVHGIGPKKASAMLRGYGSLDEINRLDALGSAAAAQTVAMRELIRLNTNVPLGPIAPPMCRLRASGMELAGRA
jgi:DNA polymerase-1